MKMNIFGVPSDQHKHAMCSNSLPVPDKHAASIVLVPIYTLCRCDQSIPHAQICPLAMDLDTWPQKSSLGMRKAPSKILHLGCHGLQQTVQGHAPAPQPALRGTPLQCLNLHSEDWGTQTGIRVQRAAEKQGSPVRLKHKCKQKIR